MLKEIRGDFMEKELGEKTIGDKDYEVKYYKLVLPLELQTKLRDCKYYAGMNFKDIMLEGIEEKCDELLARFMTRANVLETERQGLTRKPLIRLKKVVKRKVVN
jgi:hypothetical protein